jgi:hypothetical protein
MYNTVSTKKQATKSVVRSTEYDTASTKKRATKSVEKEQDPSCEKEYEARGNKYQRILKVRTLCAWPWPKKKTWVLTTISSSGDARMYVWPKQRILGLSLIKAFQPIKSMLDQAN